MDSKKILIIGFEKENAIKYPHLKDIVNYFQLHNGADYLYFRERGYFLGSSKKLKANMVYLLSILISVGHLFKFIYKNIANKYEKIIIVDNFTYIVISIFSKRTILWSHDFVTDDQPHKKSFYQKMIDRGTNFYLKKRKKIIIQDVNRLNRFCESYSLKPSILDVFYLPVSGHPIVNKQTNQMSIIPKILQIGGINQFRSYSYDLVKQYQNSSIKYELYLHGFLDTHFKKNILSLNEIPFCSTLELNPNEVYKIVKKCDIGFIGYKADNLNFYYISSASGQLVEFLKLGKPIIVFGNTDLIDLVKKYNIGVAIESLEDLDMAILYIKQNYEKLSINCKNLFIEKYNIENYLENIYSWLYKC